MVEVAPIFLEPVRRWQGLGVIAEVVLAELAGSVAEVWRQMSVIVCLHLAWRCQETPCFVPFLLREVVTPAGFEPATLRLGI